METKSAFDIALDAEIEKQYAEDQVGFRNGARWAQKNLFPINQESNTKNITINTVKHVFDGEKITYQQIVSLANDTRELTVTYHGRVTIDGEKYESNGLLSPGESVKVCDGMQFVAVYTGYA